MTWRAWGLVVAWAAVVAGCECGDPDGRPGGRCTRTSDCDPGFVCVDEACAAGPDAGPQPDASDVDGGPSCPAAERCGGACCDDAQECVNDACLPICASGTRCGASSECCAAGDLCLDDACTTPGAACSEELDCPIDAFCDPTLARCLPRGASRCEYYPPPGVFAPEQQWAWSSSTVVPASVHVMMAPAVGDVSGDGVPDVVFNTYASGTSYSGAGVLRVVRGDTGAEIVNIVDPVVCPMFGVALGDLDGDGVAEIVTSIGPCGNAQLAAFHADGTLVWSSANADGSPWTAPMEFGAPSIADLDRDGQAEVILGGAVLGHDGVVRWSLRPRAGSGCCDATGRAPLTAAYDVDADPELEVVAGNAVWNHDGSVVWENLALPDGFVAVADFFADGQPDIAVVHQGAVSIRRGSDGMVLWGPTVLPGGGRGGPPTVADFDGDGLPEIGVAGSTAYSVFDPDGAAPVLWQRTTQDASSNVTGSSVFDFDGDGRAEVVYNDECYMRVYAGADGAVVAEVPQNSHTLIEYPLIVDVDDDGNAEIVFAANAEVNRCAAIPGYTGLQAGIRVFRDSGDNWVGTRPVWNEHTYHVTNVREDLSIPSAEIANWQRFNTFRQNSQSFDAPDLTSAEVGSDASACPTSLVLTARIHNRGAVTVGAGLPVTFYAGTPAAPGRALATARTTAPILPGASTVVSASFAPTDADLGRGIAFFARADDVGDGTGENNECVEDNNVAEATYDCTSIE